MNTTWKYDTGRSSASRALLSGGALALWTVSIATAVIGNLGMLATLATRDVPAKGCGAAALDGGHDLQLSDTDMTPVRLPPRGAMVAEDIRDLQRWPSHDGLNRMAVSALTTDALAGSPPRVVCG